MASTLRRRMLATGARQSLAPVLDVTRDPRWGRIEETYGEDPYLAAELGCAYVRGIQGERLSDGVIATGKHMVGHGLAEGGLNQAPAHLGPREMRDEQLFPFEAAVREAGIASIMPAYCDVDGVPCHASHELLTGDPARRVGLRRHRRLGLHRNPDALDAAQADDGSGRGRGARAAGRRRRRAARHGGLRRAAAASPGRRPGRRGADRRDRRTGPAHEVPARPVRAPVRRAAVAGAAGRAGRRRGPGRARARRPIAGARRERRDPAAPAGSRAASRSSGRSPTAPASCSATTPTCSTSRRSWRCATTATPSASR